MSVRVSFACLTVLSECISHGGSLDVNTDNWETSFDSQMSTSNHLREDVVDITTDQPVTWTCELRPFH